MDRIPLEPIQVQKNANIQLSNGAVKPRFRSKSNGASSSRENIEDPQISMNDEDYSAYWNQYEISKNLQNALHQTTNMNMQLEEEINKLSNIENELRDQTAYNQQLFNLYFQYRDQED